MQNLRLDADLLNRLKDAANRGDNTELRKGLNELRQTNASGKRLAGNLADAQTDFTIQTNVSPIITSTPVTTATEGQPYS